MAGHLTAHAHGACSKLWHCDVLERSLTVGPIQGVRVGVPYFVDLQTWKQGLAVP